MNGSVRTKSGVWSPYFDQLGSKKMLTAAPARYVRVSADTGHPFADKL